MWRSRGRRPPLEPQPPLSPRELAATATSRVVRRFRGEWESPAPTVWPPPHTYAEVRSLAERVLPGARFRRHLYFRYSITWTRAA